MRVQNSTENLILGELQSNPRPYIPSRVPQVRYLSLTLTSGDTHVMSSEVLLTSGGVTRIEGPQVRSA